MRFISRDPVRGKYRNPLSFNPYLYCQNNSINSIDPDGEFTFLAARLFLGAVAGAVGSGMSSDWDAKAMAVGAATGMISAIMPGKLLAMAAGAVLGGGSNAYAEYQQHDSWRVAGMGFMSGMIGGGFTGMIGMRIDPGLSSFVGSQLCGGGASLYFGIANDGAMNAINTLEEHNKKTEEFFEQLERENEKARNRRR